MRGVTNPLITTFKKRLLFQSTRLMRGVTNRQAVPIINNFISIHTPHARRDYRTSESEAFYDISIHTPHARRDPVYHAKQRLIYQFQSTRLMRGVTLSWVHWPMRYLFQSTRLMRGVTHGVRNDTPGKRFQSTRLMRGVTLFKVSPDYLITDFNPHASCEAWLLYTPLYRVYIVFQSTRLMRGVTNPRTEIEVEEVYFNPHASCEAWPCISVHFPFAVLISIHTPHARRDSINIFFLFAAKYISIHTPHARLYAKNAGTDRWRNISIHTPHARRDSKNTQIFYSALCKNTKKVSIKW